MYKTFTVKIDYHMQLSDLVFKHKNLLSFHFQNLIDFNTKIYSLIRVTPTLLRYELKFLGLEIQSKYKLLLLYGEWYGISTDNRRTMSSAKTHTHPAHLSVWECLTDLRFD